jgi:hypothetical protein
VLDFLSGYLIMEFREKELDFLEFFAGNRRTYVGRQGKELVLKRYLII